jgi:hypothetical protein
MKRLATIAMAGLLAVSVAGCTSSRVTNATVIGGGVGAAIGGIATHSVGGAVVGGAIGAGTGYVLAKHSYRCQKRNIFGQIYWGWCLR